MIAKTRQLLSDKWNTITLWPPYMTSDCQCCCPEFGSQTEYYRFLPSMWLHAYSPHLNFGFYPPSSSPPRSLSQTALSANTIRHASPCFSKAQENSRIYESWSSGRASLRAGRRSGIEWGSNKWKDGERATLGWEPIQLQEAVQS